MGVLGYSKTEIKQQSKELFNAFERIKKGNPIRVPAGSLITKKNVTLEARLPYIVMNRSNSDVVKLTLLIRNETKQRRVAEIRRRQRERAVKETAKKSSS